MRSPSFEDTTPETNVVVSMVPADTSAALMVTKAPTTTSSKRAGPLLKTPPTSLHRGNTLDRGLDALASQDLKMQPEAACARNQDCLGRKKYGE